MLDEKIHVEQENCVPNALFSEEEHNRHVADNCYASGVYHEGANGHALAARDFLNAIKMLNKIHNKTLQDLRRLAMYWQQFGKNCLFGLNGHSQALTAFFEAINILNAIGNDKTDDDKRNVALCIHQIGIVYEKLDNQDMRIREALLAAIEELNSVSIKREGDNNQLAFYWKSLGIYYFKKGEFTQAETAGMTAKESLGGIDDVKTDYHKRCLSICWTFLGDCYLNQGKLLEAGNAYKTVFELMNSLRIKTVEDDSTVNNMSSRAGAAFLVLFSRGREALNRKAPIETPGLDKFSRS